MKLKQPIPSPLSLFQQAEYVLDKAKCSECSGTGSAAKPGCLYMIDPGPCECCEGTGIEYHPDAWREFLTSIVPKENIS